MQKNADGPHPFYDWKLITNVNCLSLQASIHLVILTFYQNIEAQKFDIVVPLVSLVPLTLLTIDWLANRIYFPLTVNLNYCIYAYSFGILTRFLRKDIEQLYPLPELDYFTA